MKKTILTILSYVLVAVLSATVATGVCYLDRPAADGSVTKLEQLQALILTRFIGEEDMVLMNDAAADAMVNSLGDRWSYYIPADQFASYVEQKENAYVGIGVTVLATEDQSGFKITKVTPNSPAEKAGLQPGDLIIAVEGESVTEQDIQVVQNLIRGQEGTSVNITVDRAGTAMKLDVLRATIHTPVATGQLLEGNVGLVTIVNFNENCSKEAIAAIESLRTQGAEKILFDVRNNPGGYAHELVALLDYLLPAGDLFRTVDYAGREAVDRSDAACLQIPMAVLVNGDSYSAAEFFAAALSEYDAAIVVGNQTCGKGYFQNTFQLVDGSAVALSVGKYFTPKGVCLADVGGLVPDVPVEVDEETAFMIYAGTLAPMEDPQILAALEKLNEQ